MKTFFTCISCLALLVPRFCYGQDSAAAVAPVEQQTYSIATMIDGPPKLPVQLKFFNSPGSFTYAVMSDTPSDTVYFIARINQPQSPEYWLISVDRGAISGTQRCIVAGTDSGSLVADEFLQLSTESKMSIHLLYVPQEKLLMYRLARGDIASEFDRFALPIRFKAGIRFEPYFLDLDAGLTFYLLSAYIVVEAEILRSLSLEARAGVLPGDVFNFGFAGTEWGGFIRYSIFEEKYYVVGGVMRHSNVGGAQGMSHFEESYVTDYTLLMLGAGVRLSERVILDISYYNPSKRVYGAFRFSPPEGDGLLHEKTIKGMWKIGLCFFF